MSVEDLTDGPDRSKSKLSHVTPDGLTQHLFHKVVSKVALGAETEMSLAYECLLVGSTMGVSSVGGDRSLLMNISEGITMKHNCVRKLP